METKSADLKVNRPHFVEPSSGSWIPRSQCFKDSGFKEIIQRRGFLKQAIFFWGSLAVKLFFN
jgi:hypothetical protein